MGQTIEVPDFFMAKIRMSSFPHFLCLTRKQQFFFGFLDFYFCL